MTMTSMVRAATGRQKPIPGCGRVLRVFRDLLSHQYPRAVGSGHHRRLPRVAHDGRHPAVRVFHCVRRDVDSRGLCGRALGRKETHGRLLRGGDPRRGKFRGLSQLFHGGDLALRDRGGDGRTAGCDQSPVACGRRGGALCIQLSVRAAHLRRRFLRESAGLFRSREAPRSRRIAISRGSTQSSAASRLPRFRGYRFIGYLPWSPAFAWR